MYLRQDINMDYGVLALVPIIICFLLIFISKNPFISIISGIIGAVIIVMFKQEEFILVTSIVDVFSSTSTVKTVAFILIVGAIIKATERSRGVSGLMAYLEKKKLNITSPVLVQLFTMLMGALLFVDATSSMAITSVVGKPLFNKAKIHTEKLALITNSTASPIAWLIPFGGAGALMTGLVTQVEGIPGSAFDYVLKAVPFQLYTICLLVLLVVSIIFKFEIGSIKNVEFVEEKDDKIMDVYDGKARNMVMPIITLLISIGVILFVTGEGDILKGDGASAVFYGGILTLVLTFMYYIVQKLSTATEVLKWYFEGVKSMSVVTLLLAIALVFSDLLTKLGAANYLIGIFDVIPSSLLPVISLGISAVIAFSTGTSGGTVAIVTGVLLPMAAMSGVSIPLVLGAIVSGAVFGDQNSIISDSVILTTSVTGVDAITHVKTQLPYTLIAITIAAVAYLILGFLL